jgi:hypothetical protein
MTQGALECYYNSRFTLCDALCNNPPLCIRHVVLSANQPFKAIVNYIDLGLINFPGRD